MVFSGKSPDGRFVEIIELPDHPWFLGCQFHPEYKSKPLEPHPLFVSFVRAAYQHRLHSEVSRPEDATLPTEAEAREVRSLPTV